MTAAVYTLRKELKTLIIAQDLGGQVAMTHEIENYPGLDLISGPELITKMRQQVEKFGGQFVFDQVTKIELIDGGYQVRTNTGEFTTVAIILAFGLTPRGLGVTGEEQFKGRGISFCATCDAPFYKGKTVAVVGGGNSAIGAVIELTKIAKKVYLLHRREVFVADSILVERLDTFDNLEKILDVDIVGFKGDKKLEKIVIQDKTGQKADFELAVDGTFLEIGHIAKTDWLKGLIDLTEAGQIIVDERGQTNQAGIFAAGDVTTSPYKQIVIAAGDGAKAALAASNYISKTTGKTILPDWGKKKK